MVCGQNEKVQDTYDGAVLSMCFDIFKIFTNNT